MADHTHALSFGGVADAYDRARPSYPVEAARWLTGEGKLTVLELGAGTGKLTEVLVEAGHRVIATDPLPEMLTKLRARVVPFAVGVSGAEAIPAPSRSIDVVVCAQSFHWFDHDRALPEIARVLRRGGILVLVANRPDESRPSPLPEAYRSYLEELHADAAFHGQPPWREVLARGPFGEVHEASVPHDHVLDREGLLDNARSVSWIASRPDAEREAAIAKLGSLLPEGTYTIPNLANVIWARRRRGAR
jgi:SAM-dependent methyltransferase